MARSPSRARPRRKLASSRTRLSGYCPRLRESRLAHCPDRPGSSVRPCPAAPAWHPACAARCEFRGGEPKPSMSRPGSTPACALASRTSRDRSPRSAAPGGSVSDRYSVGRPMRTPGAQLQAGAAHQPLRHRRHHAWRPRCAATNSAAGSMPCCGWRQNSWASSPAISPLRAAICG